MGAGTAAPQPPCENLSVLPRTCLTLLSHPGSTSALLDLSGLDLPPSGTTYPAVPTCPVTQGSPEQPSASVSLLDDELMSLGEDGPGRRGWAQLQAGLVPVHKLLAEPGQVSV